MNQYSKLFQLRLCLKKFIGHELVAGHKPYSAEFRGFIQQTKHQMKTYTTSLLLHEKRN